MTGLVAVMICVREPGDGRPALTRTRAGVTVSARTWLSEGELSADLARSERRDGHLDVKLGNPC